MYRDILREKKERTGWTTEELSNRSGVPVGTINKILSGETASPRYDTMEALNRAFREEEALMLGESAPYAANDEERLYTLDDYYRLPNDVSILGVWPKKQFKILFADIEHFASVPKMPDKGQCDLRFESENFA